MLVRSLCCLSVDRVFGWSRFGQNHRFIAPLTLNCIHCGKASDKTYVRGDSFFCIPTFCLSDVAAIRKELRETEPSLMCPIVLFKCCSSTGMKLCEQIRHGAMCRGHFQLPYLTVDQRSQGCFMKRFVQAREPVLRGINLEMWLCITFHGSIKFYW